MHPLWWLGIRWLSALVLTIVYPVFYFIFSPLTLYLSYGVLSLYLPATLQGTTILVGDTILVFVPACTAASAYALLSVLLFLTRGISWKLGVKLFLLGSLLILGANLLRIQVLFYLLFFVGKNYFATLHLVIWKVLSSVYVAGVWIFLTWLYRITTIPVVSDFQYLLTSLRNSRKK